MEIYTTGRVSSSQMQHSSPVSGRSTKFASHDEFVPPDRNLASRESNLSELWSQTPFQMPPDEEVLRMRSMEKDKLKEQRRMENMLPVAEKTTFASKLGSTRWSKELRQDMADIDDKIVKEMEKMRSITILPIEHYHKEKENMTEYLTKKREIFLVQMSLDTKRSEIRKLEDKIFQREEALRKSEEMLAEDSLEFDGFLKKNDEKVQEAIRKAEQQMRLKQDKVAEAKRLNSNIAGLKRDLNKFKEQLDECKKYKDFLVSLTPKEWFEEQTPAKSAQEASTAASTAEGETEEEGVEAMYFRSPNQLLEIFSDLEEKNLTLMQECQDSENVLEDLRSKVSETRQINDGKIANLRTQLQTLRGALRASEETQSRLQNKTILNMVDRKYEISSEDIMAKIAEVYARCSFEIDPSLGAIQMLTNVEARLEENVAALEGAPRELIEQIEKSREKERRLKVRAERLEKVRQEQERRAMRSLERAQAPVHKRVGKPIMFRSYLNRRRKDKVQKVEKSSDEKELVDFLSRAY